VLYVSGQLPAAGTAADIQSQTTSAMNAVKAIVEAGGSTMENVLKCTVFLTSQADFAGMNSAYVPFFPANPPARSTVIVAALVRADAKIEVECIALIPR
jgi:2-iminobutanoate/2-iminopropanoate deaminase